MALDSRRMDQLSRTEVHWPHTLARPVIHQDEALHETQTGRSYRFRRGIVNSFRDANMVEFVLMDWLGRVRWAR
jgi:hypothetical protein